MMQGHIWAL